MTDETTDVTIEIEQDSLTVQPEEITEFENKLLDEIDRAKETEALLRADLTAETLRAEGKEAALENICNELIEDTEANKTAIENENARALEIETLLRNNLTAEIQRAETAENELNKNISDVETSLSEKITTLQNNNNEIEQDIISIKQVNSAQSEAIDETAGNLTEEILRAKTAEAALNSSVEEIKTDIEGIQAISNTLSENYASKTDLNKKVDKVEGYSLISDEEITRLASVKNYDDSKVKADIDHLDLTKQEAGDYALKSDIPIIPENISAFKNDTGYLTEHQDLSNYATKTDLDTKQNAGNYALKNEIPDISNLAKKTDIPVNVSAFLNDRGYLTEHQDISHLALKTEIPYVPEKLSELENDVNFITEHQDLSNYATKTDLNKKVDKVEGYSLVSNTEIERLASIENYDDSEILSAIETLQIEVDKDKDISVDTLYTKEEINTLLETKADAESVKDNLKTKVDKIEGKSLTSNDFTDEFKIKLNEIEAGAQVNTVTSVNGQVGDIVILSGSSNGNFYPFFCVNSGSVNNEGEPDFLIQSSNSLKALAPFVYTTAAGVTYEVSNDVILDLSNYSYGSYKVFIERDYQGIFSLALYQNNVFIQKTPPEDAQENDIWVNTAVYPESSYKYTRSKWVFDDSVYLASIEIVEEDETENEQPSGDEIIEEEEPQL